MRPSQQTRGRGGSPQGSSSTRAPRSNSALGDHSSGRSGAAGRGGKPKKGQERGASSQRASPASTGPAPSLSLSGTAVTAYLKPSSSAAGPHVGSKKLKTKGAGKQMSQLSPQSSPHTTSFSPSPTPTRNNASPEDPPTSATRPLARPSSARVSFLGFTDASLAAPTPRKSAAKSKRAPPPMLDAMPTTSTATGGSPPSSLALNLSSSPPTKMADDAPILTVGTRPVLGSRVPLPLQTSAHNTGATGAPSGELTVSPPPHYSTAACGGRVPPPAPLLAEPLPPLTSAGPSLGVSLSSSLAPGQGPSPGASVGFVASSTSFPSGASSSAVKRPMTLLERRSGRERNAMSISCLSTLSVETIQESTHDLAPVDTATANPILRGWSRTVAPPSAGANASPPGQFLVGVTADSTGSSSATTTVGVAQPRASSAETMPLSPDVDGASGPFGVASDHADVASPLVPRATFAKLCATRGAFKLISYNLMADRLVTTDRYPSCPPLALGEDYRTQLMKKELAHVQADILVFAEMSVDMFEKPNLLGGYLRTSMGYAGDHVVITDQYGKPMCQARGATTQSGVSPPPLRRATVPAVSPLCPPISIPSTGAGIATSVTSSTATLHTAGASGSGVVPAPPTSPPTQQQLSRPSSRVGSNKSLKRGEVPSVTSPPKAFAAHPSGANNVSSSSNSSYRPPSAMTGVSAQTPTSRGRLSSLPQEEAPTRRTEMEGVAVYYNRNRFEQLECLPVRFNEIANTDSKLTPYERKKLQVKSHNVALISVLRDRHFPSHVYIVTAVHIIWQRVEAQLWQCSVLMRILEEVKGRYDVEWRDGKRTRPPSLVPTPAKGAKLEGTGYLLPAVFKREEDPNHPLGRGTGGVKVEGPLSGDEETPEVDVRRRRGSHAASAKGVNHDPQRAVCIVAGDFNADRTNPTLPFLCEGYIPAEAPVMAYWRDTNTKLSADLVPAFAGGKEGLSAGAGEDGDTASVSSPVDILNSSSCAVATPTASCPRSTGTQMGEDRNLDLSAADSAHPYGCPDAGAEEEPFEGIPVVPATPQRHTSKHRRQQTAPPCRKQTMEGTEVAPLWLSTDNNFPSPHTDGGDGSDDAPPDLDVSPVLERSPTPVRGNWCDDDSRNVPSAEESGTPAAHRRISLLDGSTSDVNAGEGTGMLSSMLMTAVPDVDYDAPPPPPCARRKKRPPGGLAPSQMVAGGGGGEGDLGNAQPPVTTAVPPSELLRDDDDDDNKVVHIQASHWSAGHSVNDAPPPATPSKAGLAKRRKLPATLVAEMSATMAHAASTSEGSSRPDFLNQSAAVSEAASSSVLSNLMDPAHSVDMPQNSLFTPGSLGSIFNDAAARSQEAEEGGDAPSHTPVHGNATAARQGSDSSTSLAESSYGSVSVLYAVPDVPDGAHAPLALDRPPPPALSAMQETAGGLGLPGILASPAPSITHSLALQDAYELYCRRHPHRVSAVNPSTNQEGKVLDHVLFEGEHLACASVLRLGELIELPTRNIPSDHYMVGALLVPVESLKAVVSPKRRLSLER